MVLRLAWRNLSRHRRRSGIVVTAVAVGIAGCMLSMAVNYGMVVQMVETAIATDVGHLQIHRAGYEESPEVKVRMEEGAREVVAALAARDDLEGFAPRIRAQGLLHSPRASAGVQILAVDPMREASVSSLPGEVERGAWLGSEGAPGIVIGVGLARRLQVDVGDKVVVSAQDLRGDLTGQAFRIRGVLRTPSRELDQNTAWISFEAGRDLVSLGDAVGEVVVRLRDDRAVETVQAELAAALGGGFEVRSWKQLRPLLVYMTESFDSMSWAIYAAVFIAMAFGIANVLLMTVYERTREIGMLMAVGMSRRRVVAGIVLESIAVTGLGVVTGIALSFAVVATLGEGIDLSVVGEGLGFLGIGSRIVPAIRAQDLGAPLLVALVAAAIASLWPALRAARLRPAEALRKS